MKIVCVGRNYAAHAGEMNAPVPDEPVIFLKPDTAVLKKYEDFYFPDFTQEVHYEAELYFRVCKDGKYIKRKFAPLHLDCVGVGIDFTARDLQSRLKAGGLPWEIAKAFNQSAVLSEFFPIERYADVHDLHFELRINGETRQAGHAAQMIFDPYYLVEYVSQFFTLRQGDLLFTGTPEGVGPVQLGDHLECFLEGERVNSFYVR